MSCDCLIGVFHDYTQGEHNELRFSNYIKRCKESAKRANEFRLMLYDKKPNIKPKDYLDGRKCMTTLNTYCPECGSEINYNKLRKELL